MMKKIAGYIFIFVAGFLAAGHVSADVIVLKDGRRIVTQGTWEEGGLVKYFKDGLIRGGIPKEAVASILKNEPSSAEEEPEAVPPPPPRIVQPATFPDKNSKDLQRQLSKKSPPKNEIEAAGNATVTIRAAMGAGSGFFITENGYILTNRHVIEGDPKQLRKKEQQLERANGQLRKFSKSLDARKRKIESLEQQVKSNPRYDIPHNRQVISDMKDDYKAGVSNYRKQKAAVGRMQSNLRQLKAKLLVQRTVEIVLADGTEMRASIEKLSDRSDLALLVLDGVKTPCLLPDPPRNLAQGQSLFAIGNPLNFSHSVSAGVFSGFQRGMIMTSAPINHGNSGGPLITESGRVVGINTSKIVGQGVEGIGFALPIHAAINEFRDILIPLMTRKEPKG